LARLIVGLLLADEPGMRPIQALLTATALVTVATACASDSDDQVTKDDRDPASFVGTYDGEVHFQRKSLSDDYPDVAGLHESTIEIIEAGAGLDVTFAVLGGSVTSAPIRCTVIARVVGPRAQLDANQGCLVRQTDFAGTWTFQRGTVTVSDAGELSLGAFAILEESNGTRGSYEFEVHGIRAAE
jgi:hypothetical protein